MSTTTGALASVNAALRFLLEVAALVILGYWGYRSADGPLLKVVLGLGLPLLVAVVWGMLGSPAAPYRLGEGPRLLLEVVILGGATLAIYDMDRVATALAFGVIAAINTIRVHLWSA